MADKCKNCGAELFAGQQFCRACGKPTMTLSANEMPTQALPPNPQAGGVGAAPALTSPLPGGQTGGVFPAHSTSYPSVHVPSAPPARFETPRKSSAKIWIMLVLILGLVGIGSVAAVVWAVKSSRQVIVKKIGLPPLPPPVPRVPTVKDATGTTVGEEGAEVSGDKTVIVKSYALGDGASVSLKNMSGSITIEGWDEPRAEVRIIKRGGSEDDRSNVQIREESDAKHLSLERPLTGDSDVEVEYEVKLPHTLKAIEVSSLHSDVKMSDVSGSINIELKQGDIELSDVSGAFSLKTIQGDTKVEVKELRGDAASKIESIAGDIELQFAGTPNADLKAETLTGEIDLDDHLGLKVEKRVMGERVAGRIGEGQHAVSVKAIKGDIKISK